MEVYIKERKRQRGGFQFYMPQFVEAAVRQGFTARRSWLYDVCYKLHAACGKLASAWRKCKRRRKPVPAMRQAAPPAGSAVASSAGSGGAFRRLTAALLPLSGRHRRKAIIVTSRGEALYMNAFPFFYRYEVIPMLWDVWQDTWESLYHDLRTLKCRTVFVTVKAVAEQLSRDLGIDAYWIPEGIDPTDYKKGDVLASRTIDVYELGRQKKEYHQVLEELEARGVLGDYRRNRYDAEGGLLQLAFPTAESLTAHLPQVKIIISFPQADTHPHKAGKLDTLTQRYWEAMLCRCLMVGRAPAELVELAGYNPVIDVDWEQPAAQLEHLLAHIADYQELVDRNYRTALELAPWDKRIATIRQILQEKA